MVDLTAVTRQFSQPPSGTVPVLLQPAGPVRVKRAAPPSTALKAALGERQNLRAVAQQLNAIALRLGDRATAPAIQAALASTPVDLHPDSSSLRQDGAAVTLASFIRDRGLHMPVTHFHLDALASALNHKALEHPLADFAGGLSWPIPMSAGTQQKLLGAAVTYYRDTRLTPGVLEHLKGDLALSDEQLRDPVKTLESLIGSARAQALGQAMQNQLLGLATDTSVNEFALTALHLMLDPQPHRNKVAGYDLAHTRHWGQPAGAVVDGLREHLVSRAKTSPEMAGVGAYLLLAKTAPEFLIKEIPASVTYGSPAWLSLSIAAATIEARSPGKVANMSFAQVMSSAQSAARHNPAITEHAQKHALIDWGIVNGVLENTDDQQYTPEALDSLRTTFNQWQSTRLRASESLDKEIPTRKDIARARLIERFGDLGALFEEKLISTNGRLGTGEQVRLVGRHSLLDIAMMDLANPAPFYSSDSRIPLALLNANPRFGVGPAFDQQFAEAIEEKKSALHTTVRQLIAQLPLERRKNLEYGALTFYQASSHTLGLDFTTTLPGPKVHTLLVRAERDGVSTAYEIDLGKGRIEPVDLAKAQVQSMRVANRVSETKVFTPRGDDVQGLREPRPQSALVPQSFSTNRTQRIADAFVQHLELDDPQIKEQARGRTTLDEQMGRAAPVEQFLLNLIPLRSAIVNFQQGNYREGAFDLVLDIFGFLTAGAAASGKLGRLISSTASSATKVLRGAKIIGTTLVNAFNPLGGLGDLAVGGTLLASKGGRLLFAKGVLAVNKLKGANGSYDLLKVASRQYDAAATGSLTVAGQRIETGAVLQNGKWYAFDVDKMRAYGTPLEGFTPGTKATKGMLALAGAESGAQLSNKVLAEFKVAPSIIDGLSGNSRGVYTTADGHSSYIRHVDHNGEAGVYEVRQVTRTEDGAVQARIYHNNRQTPLLVQHVQGDQWQRLGIRGGNLPSVKADLGPVIGQGGEGIVYESLDGKSVYKDLGTTSFKPPAGFQDRETECLNIFYGEGFATTIFEDGHKYIKMGKIDGVDLAHMPQGSLPPTAGSLLDEAIAKMEAKDLYHNDLQLKNFMYSAKDNKVYPVDMDAMMGEHVVGPVASTYNRLKQELRHAYAALVERRRD